MSKSQRLTWMLGAACLLLLGLTLAEFFGFGSGYRLAPDVASARPPAQAVKLDEGARKLPPWPEYGSDMLARPIFNEDRKPTPVNAKTDEAAAQPLKAALTGVIIAGELKLAMVKDEASSKTVRLRPGQNLPGEQSPWKLVDVQPRSVTFEASGLGQKELKLQVSDKPNVAPPPAPGEKPNANQSGLMQSAAANDPFYGQLKQQPAPQGDVNPDEIRRRIEERRKQLREEAQRMELEQKH
jgi:general secretion pathway protein N